MGKQVTSRNSNFELLRIISILIITVHHISMDCGIESTNMYVRLWAQFFYIGGKLGVNCFILISGYFLYKKEWKPKRIIHTEFTVLFYTILLFIIFAAFGQDITITNVLKTFIPTIFQHYWFITAYIGILLLSPILNFLINESNQKQHLVFIFVLLVIFSVIPTFTAQTVYNSDIGWFGCLYLIGSYIDKYKDSVIVRFLSKKWMFPFFTALIWLASVVFTILEFWIPAFREGTNFFTGMYILPQLLNSISLFLLFKNWSGGASIRTNQCCFKARDCMLPDPVKLLCMHLQVECMELSV